MAVSDNRHEVVVVGAGPVGVVAAAAHARQGRSVLLLEANPKAAHRFAGEWLHPTGAEILDQVGLGRVPEAGGRPGEGFIVYPDDGSEPVTLAYPAGRTGLSVEHGEFVAALRARAADMAGIDYLEGARVTGIEAGALTYRDAHGERTLRPEVIVAADGRGSKVREWAGIAAESETVSHMASVELRGVTLPRENFGYVLLGGPGPVLMYRIADDIVRLCVDVPLSSSARRNPGYLWDAYHPVFPESLREAFRRGLEDGPVNWTVNRFRPRTQYGKGNVRLVGDSVGHFHPLTAAGMTMGFLDVDALTRTTNLRAYRQSREAGSYVPELLSNALYHVFSRHDASSASVRSSVFDVWRKSEAERERTMRILMGQPQGPKDFSRAFSRMALHAFGSTVRELTGARRLGELPRAIASYRQWLQWPVASLAPRPTRLRYRGASTPFSAMPLMPKVHKPEVVEPKLTAAPEPNEAASVAKAAERTGEALLGELRNSLDRIGQEPENLLMRRAAYGLAAIENAELGTPMSARLRLGRRTLAQQGVSSLFAARAEEGSLVTANDIAALLMCLYDVQASEVDAAARVGEALDILLSHQTASGGFAQRIGGPVDLVTTQLASRALSAVARQDEQLLPRALRALEKVRGYLRATARPDGSWEAQGQLGQVSATALALSAFVHAGAPPRSSRVARACSWLIARQNEEGRFDEEGTRVLERGDVITARALEALSVARAATLEPMEHAALRIAATLTGSVVPQLEARRASDDDWQSACLLLDAVASFSRYKQDRLLFKPKSRPAPAGDDWAYCRQSLLAVSRSFSKPIAMLPGDLEIAVTCGYLLCRIADTVEDHPAVPRAAKDELFMQFLSVLEQGASAEPFIAGFMRIDGEDAELDLARNLPRVMRVFEKLPRGMVEAVTRWVCEMSRGMNLYCKRDPGPDGYTALLTTGDLERYCFFVAGTVGHMLTDLFEVHAGDALSAEERADLRTYAEGFGMGLQLVNILKDVTDDRERRWSFVPRAVAERAGTSIEHLVDPDQRERAHRAVAPLFDIARARLDDAIAYSLTIPAHETGVRLFCLLPLWMAALTLKHARGNDAMFTAGAPVKISRDEVQTIIAECAQHVGDDEYLRRRYEELWRDGSVSGAARLA